MSEYVRIPRRAGGASLQPRVTLTMRGEFIFNRAAVARIERLGIDRVDVRYQHSSGSFRFEPSTDPGRPGELPAARFRPVCGRLRFSCVLAARYVGGLGSRRYRLRFGQDAVTAEPE